MKMLSDYDLFVQLCEKREIPLPKEVLAAIKSGRWVQYEIGVFMVQ